MKRFIFVAILLCASMLAPSAGTACPVWHSDQKAPPDILSATVVAPYSDAVISETMIPVSPEGSFTILRYADAGSVIGISSVTICSRSANAPPDFLSWRLCAEKANMFTYTTSHLDKSNFCHNRDTGELTAIRFSPASMGKPRQKISNSMFVGFQRYWC